MIREPTVGMRVEICKPHCRLSGRLGIILRLDLDGFIWVRFKNEDTWPYYSKHLTEIKENDMYLDEALKAIREDENMELSKEGFACWYDWKTFHNADSFKLWCKHSGFKVRAKNPKVKELTVADIEEKYGCKVKIIK